jgi:hypothetical protein
MKVLVPVYQLPVEMFASEKNLLDHFYGHPLLAQKLMINFLIVTDVHLLKKLDLLRYCFILLQDHEVVVRHLVLFSFLASYLAAYSFLIDANS